MQKGTNRFWSLLLIGAMAVGSLVGCGDQESSHVASTSTDVATSESSTVVSEETQTGPITTEPIEISILTTRTSLATNDAEDIWFFKYLEWWMNEQGYNITIKVQQTLETAQQISLALGTDSLPYIVWGINLSNSNAVAFGAEEGMILDWTPYLNEDVMPNLMALLEKNQDALAASTCSDGAIYGLPAIGDRAWGQATGNMADATHVYINKKWLEQCDLEVPTNIDDFINMLRAFKSNIKLEGAEVIPLVNYGDLLEKYLWTSLGYYGAVPAKYGNNILIKNEEICFGSYTEDYRTFIEIMNTLYTEGLISQDYFTMDKTTARGLMSADVAGVIGDYGLATTQPEDFADWTSVLPMTIGDDTEVCAANVANSYQVAKIWANADTKYPEVIAYMLDYIYSPEGSVMYYYGPQKGEDPLEMLPGWYYDENGVITNDEFVAGKTSFSDYISWAQEYVYPTLNTGNYADYARYSKELAGLDSATNTHTYKDAITGKVVEIVETVDYKDDNADGYMRINTAAVWEGAVTTVKLPAVYMTEEESLRVTELFTVLNDYVNAESAKFITGLRPLEEIEDFWKELEVMGVEEYIELNAEAFGTYMNSVFN